MLNKAKHKRTRIMTTIFWAVRLCSLAEVYKTLEKHALSSGTVKNLDYTKSHPRRQYSS